MFEVIESLRGLIKPEQLTVDNNVFKLHYKFTTLTLVTFSLLVSCRQYLGNPIDCVQSDDIPHNVIDTYCWIHSTFTLPRALDAAVGTDVAHPGIDSNLPGDEHVYHAYYQWVCFMLFMQAILFYMPYYIWTSWECKRMRALSLGLDNPVLEEDEKRRRRALLANYLFASMNQNNIYFAKLVICELLNLSNVLFQIYLTDVFLGGEFATYGTDVMRFTEQSQEQRTDPMIRIFPRVTKCTFYTFGTSGDIQKYDALCILSINIINEKIFIFLWFWFVILATLSSLVVLYRVVIVLIPGVRHAILKMQHRGISKEYTDIVSRRCAVGDWFVIYLLGKNLDILNFKVLIGELARKFVSRQENNIENKV